MTSIHPEGEALRRAVRFVSDALREDADRSIMPIVNEAAQRFDLNPNESEYLIRFYRDARHRGGDDVAG